MIPLTAARVRAVTGGRGDVDGTVTGLAIDSRAVGAGDLFVALPGTRAHGADFADAALAAGAVAALVPEGRGGRRRIEVADPLRALAEVGRELRLRSGARVVAVTGSTGKTSTKDILTALLRPHLRTIASHASHNNEIGVPLTLGRLEADTQAAIVEMGMRGAGHIDEAARVAVPDVAVISGIGPVHLEQLGSLEAIAAAKAEVLAHLTPYGAAVVPAGEPLLAPHLAGCVAPVWTFGEAAGADVRLVAMRRAAGGGGVAELAVKGHTLSLEVSFTQHHNGLNLAAAAAAALALGLAPGDLAEGARAATLSRWRGETLPLPGGGVLIADCYNANPVSMAAALRHLRDEGDGRRTVAVLGDMAELGPDADRYHREVGELARRLGVGVVVGVGALARAYGGRWYATLDEALAGLPAVLRPGDAVLVKGSRSMGLEAVVERLAA